MMLVTLEQLKPGMVLAEPVRNHQSMLLLESGKKISPRAIRIFKSWGVTHVQVHSRRVGAAEADPNGGSPTGGDIELKLKKKFAEFLDDAVMVTIMETAGRILSRHLDRDESSSDF